MNSWFSISPGIKDLNLKLLFVILFSFINKLSLLLTEKFLVFEFWVLFIFFSLLALKVGIAILLKFFLTSSNVLVF